MAQINARVAQKHDTEANWKKAVNFIPLAGEIIVYDEGDGSAPRFKVGNGVLQADGKTVSGTNINNLPFVATSGTNNLATSDADGLMSKEDKQFINKLYVTDLGIMNGKTIADLRTALINWLKDNTYSYHAIAKFNSSNFASLWNAENLTTPLAAGSEYVVRIASTYYQESYAQLEITSYWDKEVYYVARVNSEWKPMRQVTFKDDIETYINEAILGGEW